MGVATLPTKIDPKSIKRARRLRRDMTDGERRLWSELREFRRLYGIHVRKQVPIGQYIVDFAIHEHRLIVEVDGEHHFTAHGKERDRTRDAWLARLGYRVLRLTTGELSDSFDGCVEDVLRALGLKDVSAPTFSPSLQGRGENELRP